MLKFNVTPSVRAAAVPTGTGFGAFDGIRRTCTSFTKAKGGVLRCSKFRKGRGHPVCDKRLKDGGRSPGLVRAHSCKGSGAAPKRKKSASRKRRR